VVGGGVLLNAVFATFIAMVCSGISRLQTGHYEGALWPFVIGAMIQPALMFYVASYALFIISN
jgi:hypothetical protein